MNNLCEFSFVLLWWDLVLYLYASLRHHPSLLMLCVWISIEAAVVAAPLSVNTSYVYTLSHVTFGNQSSSQYLLASTTTHLLVWNMLTCTGELAKHWVFSDVLTWTSLCPVQWCIQTSVNCLITDPFSPIAVAFVKPLGTVNTDCEYLGSKVFYPSKQIWFMVGWCTLTSVAHPSSFLCTIPIYTKVSVKSMTWCNHYAVLCWGVSVGTPCNFIFFFWQCTSSIPRCLLLWPSTKLYAPRRLLELSFYQQTSPIRRILIATMAWWSLDCTLWTKSRFAITYNV